MRTVEAGTEAADTIAAGLSGPTAEARVPEGFLSEERTANILSTTTKTLRTWASRRQGPPRVKCGRAIF